MSTGTLVLLALMSQGGTHGKAINSFLGPYIMYTDRFYLCEPDKRPLPWRWHLRTTHFNPRKPKEKQLLTGNLTGVNMSFDDSCWMKVILDARSNNQWKENAFIFLVKSKACTRYRAGAPALYDLFFRKREINGMCSHQPGVYAVENATLEWTFPNIPIMPYGHYRYRMMLGKAENLLMCGALEASLIPKVE
ncbi:uncharacterized protein LOC113211870 [Frankliniella occidentalis]|uniref:Uncharacterized protein LOC113211870 n=1 Tax=Frankliniella occidentalis TaxID=133901 RepID=A0A6J1T3I2_FRAOC|nr:uncharacterized protein LOC113211870 [Frankliniella occidentalis]